PALQLPRPRPPAGPGVFADLHRPRAGERIAGNAQIALFDQRVVGQIVLLHVEADFFVGPIEHWRDGIAAVARVPADEGGILPLLILLAANAAQVGLGSYGFEGALGRLIFVCVAARINVLPLR